MFFAAIFITILSTLLTFALLSSNLNIKTNSSFILQKLQKTKNLKIDDKILLLTEQNNTFNFLVPNISVISSLTNNNLIVSAEELNNEGNDEYLIILPFIVLFGLCGNTISFITIFYSKLRKVFL